MIVTFERDIKNVLVENEKEIIDYLIDQFAQGKNIHTTFPTVLGKISKILFEASSTYFDWHTKKEDDLQFSFFPGYVTNANERIFNSSPYFDLERLSANIIENSLVTDHNKALEEIKLHHDRDYNFDYWFKKEKKGIESSNLAFDIKSVILENRSKLILNHNKITKDGAISNKCSISLLSFAYHYLFFGKSLIDEKYDAQNDENQSAFDYCVGGTHQWVSKIADEVALNDSLELLELLVFYDSKETARKSQVVCTNWVSIPFELPQKQNSPQSLGEFDNKDKTDSQSVDSREDILFYQRELFSWCKGVVDKLDYPSNKKYKEHISARWPFNPQCEIDAPNLISNFKEYILIFRAYIISFWLQLVFHPATFGIDQKKDKSLSSLNEGSPFEYHLKNKSEVWYDFPQFFIKKIIGDYIDQIKVENILDKTKLKNEVNKDTVKRILIYLSNEILAYNIDLKEDWESYKEILFPKLKESITEYLKANDIRDLKVATLTGGIDQYFNGKDPVGEPFLKAIDCPNKIIDALLSKINYRTERIQLFKNIIKETNPAIFHSPHYTNWYVVPFKHRIPLSNKSRHNGYSHETGSAMILTNYLLDKEYFRFAIPWLEKIYDAMREFDTASKAREDAKFDYLKPLHLKIEEYKKNEDKRPDKSRKEKSPEDELISFFIKHINVEMKPKDSEAPFVYTESKDKKW